MRYELTVIVPGNLEEKDATQRLADVKSSLDKKGATDIKEQLTGREPLAYSIAKQTHGYYGTWEFTADGTLVAEVERELKLGGQVIRWLTVQAYKDPYTISETPKLAEDARSAEELLRRTSATDAPKKRAKKAEAEPEVAEGEREKQLDEALDKLLSDDATETTTKE